MGLSSMLSVINPYAALIGGAITAYGQYRANKETRNYATKMSGTAHQRQMADLKAAGINPILAGRLGGASTPSYQAGNIGAAAVQGYGQVSSAKQAQATTRATNINADIAQSSPKAVVSRIIDAIEKGLTGRRVRGAYAPFAEITGKIVLQSGEYTKGEEWPDIEPMLTPKLVAEVIKEAGKFGIKIPVELIEMAIDAVKGK